MLTFDPIFSPGELGWFPYHSQIDKQRSGRAWWWYHWKYVFKTVFPRVGCGMDIDHNKHWWHVLLSLQWVAEKWWRQFSDGQLQTFRWLSSLVFFLLLFCTFPLGTLGFTKMDEFSKNFQKNTCKKRVSSQFVRFSSYDNNAMQSNGSLSSN